jgi:hypothetical protein
LSRHWKKNDKILPPASPFRITYGTNTRFACSVITRDRVPPYGISGFRRNPDEIGALLGYYATSNGNPLPTFGDNVSVPSSRVNKSKKNLSLLDH